MAKLGKILELIAQAQERGDNELVEQLIEMAHEILDRPENHAATARLLTSERKTPPGRGRNM